MWMVRLDIETCDKENLFAIQIKLFLTDITTFLIYYWKKASTLCWYQNWMETILCFVVCIFVSIMLNMVDLKVLCQFYAWNWFSKVVFDLCDVNENVINENLTILYELNLKRLLSYELIHLLEKRIIFEL